MIQVVECHFVVIFCFLSTENATFFKSIRYDSSRRRQVKVISCLLSSPKFDFEGVDKAMFQVVARHLELIFFL